MRRLAQAAQAPWLHQEVARRMAERLPLIKQPPQRWIDWWAQAGGGHAEVSKVHPRAHCTAVEPVLAAQPRSSPWWRFKRDVPVVLEADLHADQADMLWANMMLHAALDPQLTIQAWHRALRNDGVLMFSTLGPDTLLELRRVYAQQGWPPPHVPFVDMHDLGDMLVEAGFADPVMDQETLRLQWTRPAAAWAELRALGGNTHAQRHAGLRTPRWRRALEAAWADEGAAPGRFSLRFEVIYGHAFKAPPRARAGEPVLIPVDELRASMRARRRG